MAVAGLATWRRRRLAGLGVGDCDARCQRVIESRAVVVVVNWVLNVVFSIL